MVMWFTELYSLKSEFVSSHVRANPVPFHYINHPVNVVSEIIVVYCENQAK